MIFTCGEICSVQKQTTTLLMRLHGCGGWSAPLLLQITEDRFSQSRSNCYPWTLWKHGKYDNSDIIVICAVSSKHLQFVCRHTKSCPAGDCFLYNMGCIRCISLQKYNKTWYTKVNMVLLSFALRFVRFICKTVLSFFPAYLVPNEISMYVLSQGILVSL